MNDIEIELRGPIFRRRAPAVIRRMVRSATDDIAAQGYSEVMTRLNASIRHPTPYYETQITNQRVGEGRLIHDRDIVYGPWLEGVDSRNSAHGFPGYFSFLRARIALQAKAQQLANRAFRRHMWELN